MNLSKNEKLWMSSLCEEFERHREAFLAKAQGIHAERAARLDVSTPPYMRMSAKGMLHEISKKARRLEETTDRPGWEDDARALAKISEEAADIVNYAVMLGATAMHLLSTETVCSTMPSPEIQKWTPR